MGSSMGIFSIYSYSRKKASNLILLSASPVAPKDQIMANTNRCKYTSRSCSSLSYGTSTVRVGVNGLSSALYKFMQDTIRLGHNEEQY